MGNYADEPAKEAIEKGLDALQKEDEPTLILLTDAVNLEDYYEHCKKALEQCNLLKDRFAIFDVKENSSDNSIENFRDNIGQQYLKYGAAYHPYLRTSLNYYYEDKTVTVIGAEYSEAKYEISLQSTMKVSYEGQETDEPKVKIIVEEEAGKPIDFSILGKTLTITLPPDGSTGGEIEENWTTWEESPGNDAKGFNVQQVDQGTTKIETPVDETPLTLLPDPTPPPTIGR